MSATENSRVRGRARHLTGELDMATVPDARARLLEYATTARTRTLVLDCSELSFIDSSGLQMLIDVEQISDKQIELVNVDDAVRKVFDLTGLSAQFGLG
jgi:anti-sigma B factor antagonist